MDVAGSCELIGVLLLVGKLWFGAGLLFVDSVVSAVGGLVLIFVLCSLVPANGCCFVGLLGSCCEEAGFLEGFLFEACVLLCGASAYVRWGCGSFGFFGLLLGMIGFIVGRCCGPCLVVEWWLLLDFSCFASFLGE